jgi:hypothetical protein
MAQLAQRAVRIYRMSAREYLAFTLDALNRRRPADDAQSGAAPQQPDDRGPPQRPRLANPDHGAEPFADAA